MYSHKNQKAKRTTESVQRHANGKVLKDQRAKSVMQQKKTNTTGLPDALKSGIEQMSGHSLDAVKVHYNSSKPAQLNAHAYAQGNAIHLGPGEEKHLPHEAWHVVQQKQGRVKPTTEVNGASVNDDVHLEREADVMGAKAMQMKAKQSTAQMVNESTIYGMQAVAQLGKKGGKPTGGGEPEKKKGEDYCNNVGKTLGDFEALGFFDPEIQAAIDAINALRSEVTVGTDEVIGVDKNHAIYGDLAGDLHRIAAALVHVLMDTDREYYDEQVKQYSAELAGIFGRLPEVAVDPRVASVVAKGGDSGKKTALGKLNAALLKLAAALKLRLPIFFASHGPYKDLDKKPPGGGAGGGAGGGMGATTGMVTAGGH